MQSITVKGNKYASLSRQNCTDLIVLKCTSDKAQLVHLSYRIFSDKAKKLVKIYDDIMKGRPYSYLHIDLRPTTDECLRCTNTFGYTDANTVVYI